ncbi:MAG TPA: dihydroorotase [Candidatus Scatomorpha pullicola]|nr:dihydroorotase [Candidatus Scatomorpha pullicola]
MERFVIKGCEVFTDGRFVPSDVEVDGGIVSRVEPGIVPAQGIPVFNFDNCRIVPGLVDVHVHLREPGFSYKETMATGTAAAARGGYTAVCAMPNLNPVPDSAEHLAAELEAIRRGASVAVYPYGALTVGERGEEMADIAALAGSVAAFSDDGRGVQSADMMRECMRAVAGTGKILAAHCEVNALLNGGYIHDGEYARAHGHRGICSESEWREVERDLSLAAETGCAFHVCHVSTKESVELIRQAKRRGVDVTAETAPHYLLLTDADLQEDGRFKMNPPLRGEADRAALIEALLDGTIDMIATDHAPHSAEEKSRGLEKSAMGVVGLECAFAVLYTGLVETGVLTLERLTELMSCAPARRFKLPGGEIKAGSPANLAVFDTDTEYTIDPAEFASKGRATPFEGWRVKGKCLMTVCAGRTVWKA